MVPMRKMEGELRDNSVGKTLQAQKCELDPQSPEECMPVIIPAGRRVLRKGN